MSEELALLSVAEMYAADRAAIAAGIPGEALMESAGRAVADRIRARWDPRPTAILCGPGNNGGDGFVIARLLAEHGWPVTVALLGEPAALRGDAALNAGRWTGPVVPLGPGALDGAGLAVDAIFGAGLAREVDGPARAAIEALARAAIPCVAVDVPSGVDGNGGAVLGAAAAAAMTVTFFRKKPGHVLLPGRALMGEVHCADIGIPGDVLERIRPKAWENGPALWRSALRRPRPDDQKYSRGHAVVAGGAAMTGAARLAARAAMRVGAGLTSVVCPPEAAPIYAADMASLLVVPEAEPGGLAAYLADRRRHAALIGPGAGVGEGTRRMVLAAAATGKPLVLDADALGVFAGDPAALFAAIAGAPVLMTPHEGEFSRLFEASGDKLARARSAAAASGSVVLLKGGDTVIAAPDGRVAVNANAPPSLATAGAGDVLAGIATGLMAQGLGPFDAGCAAAWIHGEAAAAFGPGLVADDLPELIPGVLRVLLREHGPVLRWRPEAG